MDDVQPAGPCGSEDLGTPSPESRLLEGNLDFGLDAPLHPVMKTMRAMRRLKPDPVPAEHLEKLVEAASWAPSAGNAQGCSWVVITDRSRIERLAPLWGRTYRLYRDTFARLRLTTMSIDRQAQLNRAVAFQAQHFAESPALIIACHDSTEQRQGLRREWRQMVAAILRLSPRDALAFSRHARRAGEMSEAASVYPGVQNLLLTARALGLAATITTLHLALEEEFKRALGIPRRVKTYALVPVGWPLGRFGAVRRRPSAESTHHDRW